MGFSEITIYKGAGRKSSGKCPEQHLRAHMLPLWTEMWRLLQSFWSPNFASSKTYSDGQVRSIQAFYFVGDKVAKT